MGQAKRNIVEFVNRVTRFDGPDYVPPAERIAVLDNDGTLWAEMPVYFQALFMLDRVRQLAPLHPEWNSTEPYASILKGDDARALGGDERAMLQLVLATHSGTTTDEFDAIASEWIATARHPQTGRLLTDMAYVPMAELLRYLRANEFKTYIVSGGGVDFLRVFAERVYGIPPEQVIGSSLRAMLEMRDGVPVIVRLPEIEFVDDKAGKPLGIQRHIGRRPIAAFGNSDGDLQMLQWTAAGPGLRLCVLVHHTDAEREWAYDRESHVGKLDQALDKARESGWTVVDMTSDWMTVFAPQ